MHSGPLYKHPRVGFGPFRTAAGREDWDGAALLQVELGALHRGQLPPHTSMRSCATVEHLHDSHVIFQEVLLYGLVGFFFPQSLQCLLYSLELQD